MLSQTHFPFTDNTLKGIPNDPYGKIPPYIRRSHHRREGSWWALLPTVDLKLEEDFDRPIKECMTTKEPGFTARGGRNPKGEAKAILAKAKVGEAADCGR